MTIHKSIYDSYIEALMTGTSMREITSDEILNQAVTWKKLRTEMMRDSFKKTFAELKEKGMEFGLGEPMVAKENKWDHIKIRLFQATKRLDEIKDDAFYIPDNESFREKLEKIIEELNEMIGKI